MLSMPRIVRPDPHRIRGRNSVPPLDRPLADPLSETKNCRNLLTGRRGSQVSHSANASPILFHPFFIAGELCRRGYSAVVTLGNTPNVNIFCSNQKGTRFAYIQVRRLFQET